jgi:hypothetical protein
MAGCNAFKCSTADAELLLLLLMMMMMMMMLPSFLTSSAQSHGDISVKCPV